MTESKDNRQELIRCALHLFACRGFDGTSTAEIVEAAGVTKPTMYHYFGSKEGLLREALNLYYRPFLQRLTEAVSLPQDIPLTFFRLCRVYLDTVASSEDFFKFRAGIMLRTGEDTAYKASMRYIEDEGSIIKNFFTEATKQAGNLRGKVQLCTMNFIGTINAVVSAYLHTGNEELLSDETIYKLRQQFLHGIYA